MEVHFIQFNYNVATTQLEAFLCKLEAQKEVALLLSISKVSPGEDQRLRDLAED